MRYKILVRMCVHFRALTGVSLNIRVSCSTDVLSMFKNGFPLPIWKWTNPLTFCSPLNSNQTKFIVLLCWMFANWINYAIVLTILLLFFITFKRTHFARIAFCIVSQMIFLSFFCEFSNTKLSYCNFLSTELHTHKIFHFFLAKTFVIGWKTHIHLTDFWTQKKKHNFSYTSPERRHNRLDNTKIRCT